MSEEYKSYRPKPNTIYQRRKTIVADKHKIKRSRSSRQSVSKGDNNIDQMYFPPKFLV